MCQFLKFHEVKGNSIVYINKDDIAIIDTDDKQISNRVVSKLYFKSTTPVNGFCVNETPEKIFINCNLDNFIRLHNYPSNTAILINIDEISILDSNNTNGSSKTNIYLKSSANVRCFVVNESPDKIIKLIETIQNKEKEETNND